MAKVKFGQGVAKIMGRIGGTIFSQNKGGNYMKNYNVPTNPQTQKQLLVRALFGTNSTSYANLTQIQRDGWDSWAATLPYENSVGDIYYLTGKGLFQKSNQVLATAGVTLLTAPPDNFTSPNAPVEITLVASVALQTMVITAEEATVPADTTYVADGAPQSNAAQVNSNALFKRLDVVLETVAWTAHDFGPAYLAVFGNFVLGSKIELRYFAINNLNGMISSYQKVSTVAVA